MDVLREEDIETILAREEEPCISIYMNIPPAAENRIKKMTIEFKNLIKEARQQLESDWGYDPAEIKRLLGPAEKLAEDRSFWQNQGAGLAVFAAPDTLLHHKAPVQFADRAIVSRYFDVKQLIPEIQNNQKYYLLALSQNQNRVYECTRGGYEEVEVPGMPERLAETLKWDDPERSIQYHTHQGGSATAIYHGQGVTDRDNEEDLLRYLRQIDQGLYQFLQEKEAPLILACVGELFPLYRKANTYPALLDSFVKGSPESMKTEEIHRQAWELVEPELRRNREEVLGEYQSLKETDKSSTVMEDIVPAAFYSRVAKLLIKEGEELRGYFDQEEDKIVFGENSRENYDLLNLAAVQTLLHGGEVYVLSEEEMPDEAGMAAVFRY